MTDVLFPYPGLRPFEPHEAAIFFGREQHVGRLLEILGRERFLAVIGPSGSGKSSLVRAGMLPAIAAGWTGSGRVWRIATMRPGDRPMSQLARALLEPSVLGSELSDENEPQGEVDPVAPIEAELLRGPRGLIDLVEDARRHRAGPGRFELLVVVDQFEELFRYESRTAAPDRADAFVDLLLESARDEAAGVSVTITMRSDFLGQCARYLDLPEALNRGQYLVPRLSHIQLTHAITEPARVFGGEVDPALANDLINAISRDSDQLPILQHALARMWESALAQDARAPRVTRDHLAATGGLEGALSRHADAVLMGLDAGDQALAEQLFRAITGTAGEGEQRHVRRPQALGDVARAAGCRWRDYVEVLEAFSGEGVNFVTFVAPLSAKSLVDISHEALIRQWHRLRGWAADEAKRAADYRRWRDRAREWKRGGELLTGADLGRAQEWLARSETRWRPTAEWAARYATGAAARKEFVNTLELINRSADAENMRKEAAERAEEVARSLELGRLEAEARAAEARADAERERAEMARQRVKDLEAVISEIPDEALRKALSKKYLPDSIKLLSTSEEKRLDATLGSTSRRAAKARSRKRFGLKLWEPGVQLRIGFIGGTPAQHKKVKQLASVWTKYANIGFEFTKAADAEIRVAFDPIAGSWSYVGTDALAIPKDQPTMNLGWIAENVTHEFGHVLGLIHETNNPHADLPWNKPAVYRDLQGPPNNWTKEMIDTVIFSKYEGIKYREFDPLSIMSYSYPASWFTDGRALKGGTTLSKSDKAFIRELYPPTPAKLAPGKASRASVVGS